MYNYDMDTASLTAILSQISADNITEDMVRRITSTTETHLAVRPHVHEFLLLMVLRAIEGHSNPQRIVVTPHYDDARETAQFLHAHAIKCSLFPDWGGHPEGFFNDQLARERAHALYTLYFHSDVLIICSYSAYCSCVPRKSFFEQRLLTLVVNEQYDLHVVCARLTALGYRIITMPVLRENLRIAGRLSRLPPIILITIYDYALRSTRSRV